MEERDDFLLQLLPKIDQDVSAGDQIEPRKGRVFDETMAGEEAQLAQFAVDLPGVILPCKEALQPFRTHIFGDASRVSAFPGERQCLFIDVSSKHLHLRRVSSR